MEFIFNNQWDDLYLLPTICFWWRKGDASRWWITFYWLGIKVGVTWYRPAPNKSFKQSG